MVQTAVDRRDSHGESINHKLDYMIGNREHGQLVQIDRANRPLPVGGVTVRIGPMRIEGVGAAVLYTANDAFGTINKILVPESGVIQSITFYDKDDEGLNMTALFFREEPAAETDNAAISISDTDLLKLEAVILIDSWHDLIDNQIGREDNLGIAYTAPSGTLWVQWVTRGGPTIAAGSEPFFEVTIVSD